MRLTNKSVIITGAGRGIGRTMALRFAVEGAYVVVADIDRDAAHSVAAEITSSAGKAHAVEVDVSKPAQVESMIEETAGQLGQLDSLVNNAGIGMNIPFLDTTLDDWQRMLGIVLTGTFLCAQAAARIMVKQHGGTIVNIASISGQRGAQGRAAYGAAKAGVIQLTRVMAVELAKKGVRVNAISPGPVDTDQSRDAHTPATREAYLQSIPLHRYGERAEVAAAALFLVSDEASFIHGHVLNVDGGFRAAGLMFED